MMEKPGGRRHDAFTDYHQRLQMGDEAHGYEAVAVSTFHQARTTHEAHHAAWDVPQVAVPSHGHVLGCEAQGAGGVDAANIEFAVQVLHSRLYEGCVALTPSPRLGYKA